MAITDDPFKPIDLDAPLSRLYKIRDLTFKTDTVVGTYVVYPAWDLIAQEQLHSILKHYTLFRAGIRVKFVMNGSPYTYGNIAIGYQPCGTYNGTAHPLGAIQRPQLVSFTENNTVEINWKWGAPTDWIKYDSSVDDYKNHFGSVYITMLTKLYCNNSTDSEITLSMFAQFDEPVVAGYRSVVPTAFRHGRRKGQISEKSPPTSSTAAPQHDPVQEEGNRKVTSGTLSGVVKSVAGVAPLLSVIPGIGEIAAPVGMIAGVLGPILEGLGFAKPRTDAVLQHYLPRYYGEASHVNDASPAVRLCLDPSQRLADDVTPDNRWSWHEIAQIPSHSYTFIVPPDTVAETAVGSVDLNPYAWGITDPFMSWAASAVTQYRFWKGGYKFSFKFICGKFLSARFAIRYIPVGYDPAAPYNEDYLTHVVDVRGDTDYEFVVPYLAPTRYVTRGTSTGTLRIELLNRIVGGDPDIINPVVIQVWSAMAPDFQAFWYMAPQGVPTHENFWDHFQDDEFEPFSSDATGFAEAQFVADEQIYDLVTLLKTSRVAQGYAYTNLTRSQVQRIYEHMFLFKRGSSRVTLAPANGATSMFGSPMPKFWAVDRIIDGFTDLEFPFYQQFPYVRSSPHDFSGMAFRHEQYASYPVPTGMLPYASVGEDFELGWLLRPYPRSLNLSVQQSPADEGESTEFSTAKGKKSRKSHQTLSH